MATVRIECDPKELAIFRAGPILDGDPEGNSCVVGRDEFEHIKTTDGKATKNLESGQKYCLKYLMKDGTKGDYSGRILLLYGRNTGTFYRINVTFSPDGEARGQDCFLVKCGET